MIELNVNGIETITYLILADDCQGEIMDECPDRFHGVVQIKDPDDGPTVFHKGCYLKALCDDLELEDRFSMIDPDSNVVVTAMGPGATLLRKAFDILGIGWYKIDMKVDR